MNQKNINITREKNKHLSNQEIENIVREYDEFVTTAKSEHKKKDKKDRRKFTYSKRNIGKTVFMKTLAEKYNTCLASIYNVISSSIVTILDQGNFKKVHSAQAVINKRAKKRCNKQKLIKVMPFINLVIKEIKNSKFHSIDETIHDLILNRTSEIEGFERVCTKTIYNYIHQQLIDLKAIELPRMVRRKSCVNYKSYTPKKQRGDSIDLRPFKSSDRESFGNWEDDLVTGPRDGVNGAFLTLIERKTRFYYMIPIKNKKAKTVYMAINKLNKFYGNHFKDIFKTITFDNGNEFARYKDMEFKPGSNEQRTKIYFAHPYASYERGSIEVCNQHIRYYIPKGTDINTLDKSFIRFIQLGINDKKRKILGYKSSESIFKKEIKNTLNIEFNNLYF